MKVTILGYYGVPNIGDEAILAGMLQKLRPAFPDASIKVSARDETYVRRMHDVETFPLDQMRSFVAVASKSDIILVGGGGLLFDTPFQVLPFWLGRIVAARSVGTPSVLYSVGVGPIEKRRSRRYLRLGLRYADAISVRDEYSAELLRKCGVKREVSILPDPALLLEPAAESRAKEILREEGVPEDGGLKIGVSLRYWQAFDESQQKRFASSIRNALEKTAAKSDVSFVMVPFQLPPALGDVGLMEEIAAGSACEDDIHFVRDSYTPAEVKALLGQMDLMLGMRLHSLIFSLSMGVPSIALSYASKVASTMESFGFGDYCLPLNAVTGDKIVSLTMKAIERKDYSERLLETCGRITKEVDGLHDRMLARLGDLAQSR
ncbi:MAG: polysaccharide pyruvyl transferase family protein [Thermoplasmata archaeon]|nr:polysaccharide pyruvyl transferase family protein [Thermoplasmata archaeon]